MTTPTLRFPEFSDQWKTGLLGDVATFSKGKGISKADIHEDGDTPCIRYGQLYTQYGCVIDEVVSATRISPGSLRLSVGGEVLVPASGEDAKDIATAAVVLRPGIALGGDLNIITSKNDGRFLAYYLSSDRRSALASMAQGNSVVHLYPKQLATLAVSLPSLPEQKRIADALSAVDAKINLLEKQRDTLKRFKAGLMQQIFSQSVSLPIDNDVKLGGGGGRSSTPESRTRTARLGDIALRIRDGFVVDESGEIPPIIDLENIEGGTGRILGGLSSIRGSGVKHAFEAGDVLFGKLRPYLRKHAHPSFAGGCSTEIWVLRPSTPDLVPGYLYFMVQTDRFVEAANVSTGSRMPRAEWDLVSQIEFEIPCVAEQERIVQGLESVDAKIDLCAKRKDLLLRFRSGLVQRIFPQGSSL